MKPVAATIGTIRPRRRLRLPLAEWIAVAQERRALARLDRRGLADIGLDRASALREARRPFWDLPQGR